MPSAASQMGTALPSQASGLSLLMDSRSVLGPRPCRLLQAATPQPERSSRGVVHAPTAMVKIAKRVSRYAGDYLMGEGNRDAVLFLYATSLTVMM